MVFLFMSSLRSQEGELRAQVAAAGVEVDGAQAGFEQLARAASSADRSPRPDS